MPATSTKSTSLVSLNSFKDWMKVKNPASDEDDRFVRAVDAASEEIEKQTARIFVTRTLTETVNGTGQAALILKYAPISDASAVTLTVNGTTLVNGTDFYVDTELGAIEMLNRGSLTRGQRNVVVTYPAGFDKQDGPALPADVVRACLDLAKAIYNELTSNAIAMSSITMGPTTTVIKAEDFPRSVSRVIRTWKSARIVR